MTTRHMNFENSLGLVLTDLNKKDWKAPLTQLAKKFSQLPLDEEDSTFQTEVLNMLHNLRDALRIDADTPLPQLTAIRFAALDFWTYRFFRDGSSQRQYLDPLTASDTEFTHSVCITQSADAYPAPDIIKRWAREHLR